MEWQLYDEIDPVGEWRADYRLAYMSSLIVNIVNTLYPPKGQKPKLTTPNEMLLEWEIGEEEQPEAKQQSIEDMKKAVMKIAQTFGGGRKGSQGRIVTTKTK